MGGGGNTMTSYADNTEGGSGSNIARASPPSMSKPVSGTGRTTTARKGHSGGDGEDVSGILARVVRDRKASGDEELTLKTGDVVHVLSTKRTGYLKCEFGDDIGYVPSSYLEFFDEDGNSGGGSTDRDNGGENQSSEKRKKKKEKRHKEKKLVDASDPEESVATTTTPRSPRKVNGDRDVSHPADDGGTGDGESPRKSKKKHHKDSSKKRRHGKGDDEDDGDTLATKRGDDTERRKSSKKHGSHKKKRHYDSSESSESDDDSRHHKGRHRRNRRQRHDRGDSDSEASSSYYSSSDSGYLRSRRRHRHHRKSSSEDEDYDTDKRKVSKRRSRRRGSDDDGDDNETPRSSRRNDKKRRDEAATTTAAETSVTSPRKGKEKKDTGTSGLEKGVAKLEVQTEKPASRTSEVISDHLPSDQDNKRTGTYTATTTKTETARESGSARTKKDDESRSESTVAAQKAKTNLGKQIGEKMRSLLGGGKKTDRSHKSSSGILNACPGTTQGEEGWYEHGENERYYFVLVDGKWSLLYGPMTEDDFELYSNKVLEQNRMIELPPTYLHKAGYFLNQELRVQKL
uniref:SH3 domain-containing protein n=1 Tax=Globisporangium ultimum (strain ATCC 200006 / CBS 805.95 / DAOM BR144) TaxID=431595 RepID=K3WRU5_GLOUD